MSHHLLHVNGLRYSYPDGQVALRGIDFDVFHGESVAIVGANGAGKSTLLLHLSGIFIPQEGMVHIGDFPVAKKTLTHVRKTVGMVFQDPDDQLFMPMVRDDVAFGPLNLGLPTEEVESLVDRALAAVGCLHLKNRPSYRLSAGEKRSVAIATVLSMSPNILVLDEPTSHLDPRARRLLIRLLQSFEHTKIIATHDLDMVLDLCPRTIVIKDGTVAADGPTVEIMGNEALLGDCSLEKPLRLQACPVCNPVT